MKALTFILSLFVASVSLSAQSPVGVWKTIDDETNKAKSHVEIYEKEGKLFGKIVKIIDPAKQDKVCDLCPGDKKNQAMLGLEILWDLEADGSAWDEGEILDPNNGKVYSCSMKLDGSNTLEVRGYLGFSLLGRSQYWERVATN